MCVTHHPLGYLHEQTHDVFYDLTVQFYLLPITNKSHFWIEDIMDLDSKMCSTVIKILQEEVPNISELSKYVKSA